MTDIFLREDLWKLLKGKKVVFMGDSNVRSYYKDMLCLNTENKIIDFRILKDKMEDSVFKDRLLTTGERTNGRHYREERQLLNQRDNFSFYFLTRVYNGYVEDVLKRITLSKQPDVLIISSCLWDLARWGPYGVEEYKENIVSLMKSLRQHLKKECLVIWTTTPPLAAKPHGGFLLVQLDFLQFCLRFHVMEANTYAQKIVVLNGYDVLDLHYHLRMQLQLRCKDGIHWQPQPLRYITNLLLTHISLAWGMELPRRFESIVVDRALDVSRIEEMQKENMVPQVKKSNLIKSAEKRKENALLFLRKKKFAENRKEIRTSYENNGRACHRLKY